LDRADPKASARVAEVSGEESGVTFLKRLLAKHDDPYAGADIVLARRMAAILAVLGSVLALVLWPLSPVDRQIGDLGWVIGATLVLLGLGLALSIRRYEWTFEQLLCWAYVWIGAIATMQWLAGGEDAPYQSLLLLPMLFAAATNPPRRILPVLATTGLALVAPLAYSGWSGDIAAGAIAKLVIWTALGFAIFTMMSGVRAQRLAMRREEARARVEARRDDLTGIGNRRAFEETLENEVARAGRMSAPLSMAMFDLDDFKRINDEWGHVEGDKVLRRVAESATPELRAPDTLFRWGGDEFAVILPGATAEGAERAVDRLLNKIAAACRRPDGEPVLAVVGVAELHEGMTGAELVVAADLALMSAKSRAA
jgi:diguanylate cyclase (GGDEF)-like protein